ncbi:ATPase BadF/BadG/BcrA/BcrD type [Propionibacterium freudenreichii]|nr:ATPase BadF/BadG/BcrA/BcrD type [Propionibacterium freudenreichii]
MIGESEHAGVLTDRPLLPQLATAVRSGLHAADSTVDVAAIGVSGLVDNADASELLDMLAGTGIREVLLAHDSTTSYLGAIGDELGAVVAAGTGSVTLAVGATRTARVDGWGYLIGDAGSGFWIGRAALDRAMQAHDGRGAPTALTAVVRRDFDDLEEAYLELQADELKVSRIAGYAQTWPNWRPPTWSAGASARRPRTCWRTPCSPGCAAWARPNARTRWWARWAMPSATRCCAIASSRCCATSCPS